jgi:metal-dependent amidase/aminoacylase/carboxypeptidase family protein
MTDERDAFERLGDVLPGLEALYKDIHSNPELSMQETRTAGLAAERLRATGFEVITGVGKTGVVGLLRNGEGPTVMMRADMDALPVEEATGLPYASKVKAKDREGNTVPVMHACGHDMHVAWLAGAAALLSRSREAWKGTAIAVFQPAEETAQGAQAMIDDGLLERIPKPDVVMIKLNIRTFDEGVRKRVLAAIERIVNAEAAASGAPRPPEITPLDRYALTTNDPVASERILQAFRDHFSENRVRQTHPTSASEDFGCYGSQWQVPSVFWFVGGTDPQVYAKAKEEGRIQDIPTNHNPRFAPVLHPTLEAGVEAMVVAARAWLSAPRA